MVTEKDRQVIIQAKRKKFFAEKRKRRLSKTTNIDCSTTSKG